MGDTLQSPMQGEIRGPLDPFIEILVSEKFAQSHHLADHNIEEIGEILEKAKTGLVDLIPPDETLKNSFELCMDAYCGLLMELESMEFKWDPTYKLSTLQENQDKTFYFSRNQPTPHSDDTNTSFTNTNIDLLPGEKTPNLNQEDVSELITSKQGGGFFHMASLFDPTAINQMPLPPFLLEKLRGQGLACAVEAEFWQKFRPALTAFWPHREKAIGDLIGTEFPLDLKKELKTEFGNIAANYPVWLLHKYPLSLVMRSFVHYKNLDDERRFLPNLLDMGAMLFFFGNTSTLGDYVLTNYLGAQGLEELELIEVTFRLSRLQKLLDKCVSSTINPKKGDIAQIEDDTERLLRLLSVLEFCPPGDIA